MPGDGNFLIGIASGIAASLFFGTVFVPIKKYNAGDGIYTQWVMCISLFLSGIVVYICVGAPPLYPLAMIGGALWTIGNPSPIGGKYRNASGNALCIPIMDEIGMAVGILVWSTVSCITGWATSRFGFFGQLPNPPKSSALNYIGVAFVVASLLSAVLAALVSGFLFGNFCVPVNYMMDHAGEGGWPTHGLHYIFSQFLGILLTSSVIFVGYAITKRNRPVITAEITLPAIIGGLFLGIGMSLLFVATENLSQSISFPIVVEVPGCIATLWSVFYFKEIQGTRNYVLIAIAFSVASVGVTMVAMSREIEL